MIDPSAQAFTRQGIQRSGVAVTFQRVLGVAPNTFTFSAEHVMAIVGDVMPDTEEESQTGYSAREPGSISQDDRRIIVMAQDLQSARFALPLRKGDNVIVEMSGEKFQITRVDAYKRALAGAIELVATGVS